MRTLSLKLPRELDSKVEALARSRHTTRSAIVREAIEQYAGRVPGSFGELAADLCGALSGGPRTLSSARKHLDGFGE